MCLSEFFVVRSSDSEKNPSELIDLQSDRSSKIWTGPHPEKPLKSFLRQNIIAKSLGGDIDIVD